MGTVPTRRRPRIQHPGGLFVMWPGSRPVAAPRPAGVGVLEGLDAVDWAGRSHACDPAADTPDLLRQAASDDLELVKSALSDLYGSVFHQGNAYPATVVVVPFLVELAHSAKHSRSDFVWMVGSLADRHHVHGREAPAVRDAVAAQADPLTGLLDVRTSTFGRLRGTRRAGPVPPRPCSEGDGPLRTIRSFVPPCCWRWTSWTSTRRRQS